MTSQTCILQICRKSVTDRLRDGRTDGQNHLMFLASKNWNKRNKAKMCAKDERNKAKRVTE